jgi:hypothetical protein
MKDDLHTLESFSRRLLSRILTQVCRDPYSPAYGSFDRNWWHYKIRDFASIILQQGGYTLYCASVLPGFADRRSQLQSLARASCRFWNRRAGKVRAFEEYYPWEEGYPPAAFSALAVSKLIAAGVVPLEEVFQGIAVAARQLQSRFESDAGNQQVAGTAALCWIRKIAPNLVDESVLREICDRTLAGQHAEGWYMEYGGPDLGYLSVTMDCLWDAFDATGDPRFRESARLAMHFISRFMSLPHPGAGMHNSRNTDYIVPFGIARFLEDETEAATASFILAAVLDGLEEPEHFLSAVDDRYYCHYIGHSLFRALPLIAHAGGLGRRGPSRPAPPGHMKGSGHYFHPGREGGCDALVSCRKGGIATFWFGEYSASDFGWVVRQGERSWVSHWWSDFWETDLIENGVLVRGMLTPHKENESTPFKHFLLRVMSLVLGRHIIGVLKERMIFKGGRTARFPFSRKIVWADDTVRVEDRMQIPHNGVLIRAPRASKRHVASADSYNREDLVPVDPRIRIEEHRTEQDSETVVVTTYRVRG